jgi:hypothetical protein
VLCIHQTFIQFFASFKSNDQWRTSRCARRSSAYPIAASYGRHEQGVECVPRCSGCLSRPFRKFAVLSPIHYPELENVQHWGQEGVILSHAAHLPWTLLSSCFSCPWLSLINRGYGALNLMMKVHCSSEAITAGCLVCDWVIKK